MGSPGPWARHIQPEMATYMAGAILECVNQQIEIIAGRHIYMQGENSICVKHA